MKKDTKKKEKKKDMKKKDMKELVKKLVIVEVFVITVVLWIVNTSLFFLLSLYSENVKVTLWGLIEF